MALGSKIKMVLWILLLAIIGTGLGLWWALPGMVEKQLPFYAKDAGIDNLKLEVRNISLFRADIGSVVIGDPAAPAATIASLQADYSPWDLLHKKVKSIKIAGVQVYAQFDGESFSLRGLKLPASKSQEDDSAPALPEKLPVEIGSISLDSASVNLDWGGKAYRLALAADLITRGAGVFDCNVKLFPRGQDIACNAAINLPARNMEVRLDSDVLDAGRFGDLIHRFSGVLVQGGVKLNAQGGWNEAELAPVSGSAAFIQGQILSGLVRLVSTQENPLTLKASFQNNQADLALENIHISQPVNVEIPALQTSVLLKDGGLTASGGFDYKIRALPDLPFSMETPAQAKVEFTAARSGDGKLEFSIKNIPPKKDITLIHEAAIAFVAQPEWKAHGATDDKGAMVVDFFASLPVINVETGVAQATIPGLACTGKVVLAPGKEPAVSAVTEFKDARVWGISPKFQASGIQGIMPFTYPSQTDQGSLSIRSISLAGKRLGSASMDLERKDMFLSLAGNHPDLLIPGLNIKFGGNAGLDDNGEFQLNSHFGVDGHQISGLDMKRFADGLKGYTFDGLLTVKGFASFNRGKLETGMEASLTGGKIQAPEYQMEMTGVSLSLNMEDLVAVRSAPRQVFSFDSIKAGAIQINKGRVEFIVESPQSFFVERSSFSWCKGRVYSPAIHLQAGVSDYELLLFCDRLDFVELLKQLGAPSANGSGSLNGIVPVRITDGKFRFDQGHLYSTPGDGGALKIKGGDDFMNGINSGTPQAGQIALAKLALEDYQYEWAKLEINSEGENLMLKLQLDGKPSGPLPLVPDPKTGNFQKVDNPEKGAIFQGIKLNLNIKLPLDLILKYGIKLKDYF
ncbi:hypothetical protein Dalk_5273 [Desulfatibacillum aliphaticivorans]|uniref:Uncharacterized protein n=1 Tax=Desulfatibacillum aliphaticivorans TaxID=218208 RepID=B8FEG2_DESAL|nr:YdbH domain-containing protein [Desulfatibacillum aliphaticivorans]ACL06943.1 hypothetical protein Dalk_5273 [Desulfatibacillum aliphaticivorans]